MSLKKIKNILQISLLIINFVFFISHIFYLKTSSKNTQFNSTSTFFLNIYIIILLVLCVLNSFNSTIFSSLISSNISMLTSIKGKAIFLILLSLIYIGSDNVSQMLIGIMMLVCGILLIAMEKMCTVEDKEEAPLQNVCNVSNVEEVKEKEEKDKNNPYNVPEDF